MAKKGEKLSDEERFKRKQKIFGVEREELLQECLDLLLGFTPSGIIRRNIAKKYGIGERQVENYLKECRRMISSTIDHESLIKQRIAQGETLISKAIANGDLRTAMTGYVALNRLGGLERSVSEVHHYKAPNDITIELIPNQAKDLGPSDAAHALPSAPPPGSLDVPAEPEKVSKRRDPELFDGLEG